jgi:hypothetical protein
VLDSKGGSTLATGGGVGMMWGSVPGGPSTTCIPLY